MLENSTLQQLNETAQDKFVPRKKKVLKPRPTSFHQVKTNSDLAKLLGIKSAKLLTWLGKTKSTHYSKLFIRKKGKNSKLRVLHNPDTLIRVVQYRIYSKILTSAVIPDYIYAFERDKSIPLMAVKHVGKKIVISVDIKDFFHSIKQNTLFDMFKSYGFDEKPARTLSELCTFKAFVPQGAITSPKISNIISSVTFGPLIKAYCDGKGLTLTVYADDITISTDKVDEDVKEILTTVTGFVNQFGFRINTKKTKVMRRYNRQYVCGVVVNEKMNLIRKERLRLRAIVHNLLVNGPENEALKTDSTIAHFINVLRGRLNWFKQLNSVHGERLMAQFNEALEKYKDIINPVMSESESQVDTTTEMLEDDVLPWETDDNQQEQLAVLEI